MPKVSICVAGLAAMVGGCASQMPPAPPNPTPSCIAASRVDRTEIVDDRTILFKMLDKTVYKNTLSATCPGLSNDVHGFIYEPIPGSGDVCANLQTIRLLTTHEVCFLGTFTRVDPVPSK